MTDEITLTRDELVKVFGEMDALGSNEDQERQDPEIIAELFLQCLAKVNKR